MYQDHMFYCMFEEKGEFQISGLVGLCNSVPGKGMQSAFVSPCYTTQ